MRMSGWPVNRQDLTPWWMACGVAALVWGFGVAASAQEAHEGKAQEEIKEVIVVKQITGEVTSLSPLNEPRVIGIAHERLNADYFFHIDPDIEVVNTQSLQEIERGDLVTVTYHEITRVTEEQRLTSQVAKKLEFLSPAITGLRSKRR